MCAKINQSTKITELATNPHCKYYNALLKLYILNILIELAPLYAECNENRLCIIMMKISFHYSK